MAIQLTPTAVNVVRRTMEKEQVAGLRLGVQGGGCSGMSYVVRYEARPPRPTDHIFEFDGARVFIDPKSMKFLDGLELDWEESLMQRGFHFQNPNATKTCSCGTSFNA
jgi:iron-sulfur cluster assembly protein